MLILVSSSWNHLTLWRDWLCQKQQQALFQKKPLVIVIGGSTASGKSDLSLSFARLTEAVIINGDSMQVYQGLPLLTAQPSAWDCAQSPHEMYAILPATTVTWNAQKWYQKFLETVSKYPHHTPIVVGGTGFYLETLLRGGLDPMPPIPPQVTSTAATMTCRELAQDLSSHDGDFVERYQNDKQRLQRAWCVQHVTGKPLSWWHRQHRLPPCPFHCVCIQILPSDQVLRQRYTQRWHNMLQQGVVQEVEDFLAHHPQTNIFATLPHGQRHVTAHLRTIKKKTPEYLAWEVHALMVQCKDLLDACKKAAPLTQALGFDALSAYLAGYISKEHATAYYLQKTRQYIKKQKTWFRHKFPAEITIDPHNAQDMPFA